MKEQSSYFVIFGGDLIDSFIRIWNYTAATNLGWQKPAQK
jgi:hypothetical protein